MQNLTNQSEKVKEYFVHALKGLGLRKEQGGMLNGQLTFLEMTEAEILQTLQDPQTSALKLRELIKLAIVQQYQLDAGEDEEHCSNYIRKKTAFDNQTVKSVLVEMGVQGPACDKLLRGLTAAGVDQKGNLIVYRQGNAYVANTDFVSDTVVDTVIQALMQGVAEQKMSVENKVAIQEVWLDVMFAEFEATMRKNPQFYDVKRFTEWKRNRKDQMYNRFYNDFIILRKYNCARAMAKAYLQNDAICDLPVKQNNDLWLKLKANANLLNQGVEFYNKRLQAEGKPAVKLEEAEEQMTVGDVLAVCGNDQAQITTFFQTRSVEQQCNAALDPKGTESKKENKIGNVLGEKGRKFVENRTGSKAVIDYDVVKGLKSGKAGPWRGYKSLFDRINKIINRIYGPVQAIGFTQGIITRETGYSFVPENNYSQDDQKEEVELKDPVATDFEELDKDYDTYSTPGFAREFYAKTRARILNDKMTVISFGTKYDKLDENATDQEKQFKAYKDYIQGRIARGELVLANKMPTPNDPRYNDQQYFTKLEEYILAEKENQNLLNNINYDKSKASNDFMADSLTMFQEMANEGVVGEKENQKREAAQAFFNLDSAVEEGRIQKQDLDGMTERFFNKRSTADMHSRLLKPKVGDDVNDLSNQVQKNINAFVMDDLKQNAQKESYDEYNQQKRSQAEAEIIQRNRSEIYEAATKSMDDRTI